MEMEYLGFWVTQNRIQPKNRKVEAIVNMKPPKTTEQMRVFIGLVNYYMYTWDRWSHLLQPLTAPNSNKVKSKWIDSEQNLFDDIKRAVNCDTIL